MAQSPTDLLRKVVGRTFVLIAAEPAETRIRSLAVSSALSASWQTPVFPHVVLHGMGLWFLGMCEYKKKTS